MMSKTPAEGMVELAKLAGGLVEAVVEQEAQMLHLVQVEMEALARPAHPATPKEAEAQQEDTEASFDNVPI